MPLLGLIQFPLLFSNFRGKVGRFRLVEFRFVFALRLSDFGNAGGRSLLVSIFLATLQESKSGILTGFLVWTLFQYYVHVRHFPANDEGAAARARKITLGHFTHITGHAFDVQMFR